MTSTFMSKINGYAWLRNGVNQLHARPTCKIAVDVESSLLAKFESNEVKPSRHPGLNKAKNIALPNTIAQALLRSIGDYPVKTLITDCKRLNQYISSRHPPPERDAVHKKVKDVMEEVDQKMMPENPESLSEDEADKVRKSREKTIRRVLAQRVYAWKPIMYDKYQALVYAIGRGAQEYGILFQIFKELEMRDPIFQPKTFFDFGSGVGTGMWASSSLWKQSIFEYYNVDSSREMHEFSDLVLCEGNENQKPTLQNVYYRQFLPGMETKYDLVLSSFSLFELPNTQSRKEVLLNLWRKCDGYLVIVEEGSRKGSELVNEAREYLLCQEQEELRGFVFAPCPHDNECPRLAAADDRTPCNFEVSYQPLKIGDINADRRSARYCYVVLKKGSNQDRTRQWPRLVRPTLVRSKHVICNLCTSEGNLQEIIFTQSKHGRPAYRCAKASRWGDRLPIKVGERYDNKDQRQRENDLNMQLKKKLT